MYEWGGIDLLFIHIAFYVPEAKNLNCSILSLGYLVDFHDTLHHLGNLKPTPVYLYPILNTWYVNEKFEANSFKQASGYLFAQSLMISSISITPENSI